MSELSSAFYLLVAVSWVDLFSSSSELSRHYGSHSLNLVTVILLLTVVNLKHGCCFTNDLFPKGITPANTNYSNVEPFGTRFPYLLPVNTRFLCSHHLDYLTINVTHFLSLIVKNTTVLITIMESSQIREFISRLIAWLLKFENNVCMV